jgi:hypothetical protein
MPKVAPLLDSAKVDFDELHTVIKGLNDIETQVGAVLGSAHDFIGNTDEQLQERLGQLHVTLMNLKVITTHAKALVETLGEKPSRIIFSGKPTKLTPEADIIKSREPLPAKKP